MLLIKLLFDFVFKSYSLSQDAQEPQLSLRNEREASNACVYSAASCQYGSFDTGIELALLTLISYIDVGFNKTIKVQ